MDTLVIALGPAFAAGFALQRLLEILDPLLDKMGVEYDPSKKHSGYMNEDIGKPGKPETLRI